MKLTFDNITLDLKPNGKSYAIALDDRTAIAEIIHAGNGKLDLLIDGDRVTAYVSSDNARRWVTINGRTVLLTRQSGTRKSVSGHHHAAGELTAPMPGQVRTVNVSEGDTVTKGQTIMVLEAMKMEIKIQAPMDGVVKLLTAKVGQTVEREQILLKMEDG